jgi:aspartate ammonia-lyase
VQPGSSIMPGKVNPVLAEMLNMAMFHVHGQRPDRHPWRPRPGSWS